jgi:hypothetical protein
MGNTKHFFVIIWLVVLSTVGCTAVKTFPTAARPGETVALAVGSPDNLTIANINSVQFESAAAPGSPVDITSNVRSVFRLYADKTSLVYKKPGVSTDQIVRTSAHEPWLTVIALDMPEELSPGVPLPVGPGYITINTNSAVTYPTIGSHINDKTIALEILPESQPSDGTPSTFEYEFGTCCTQQGDLSQLEPLPRVLFKSEYSEDPFNLPGYGAIEVKLDFTGTTDQPISDSNIRVVPDDMTVYSESNRQVITGINGQVLTVIMTSMNEGLKPYEMRFAAVLDSTNSFLGPLPTISSIKHYDINGNEVTDLTNYSVELR